MKGQVVLYSFMDESSQSCWSSFIGNVETYLVEWKVRPSEFENCRLPLNFYSDRITYHVGVGRAKAGLAVLERVWLQQVAAFGSVCINCVQT